VKRWDWSWLSDTGRIAGLFGEHAYLATLPVLLGLICAVPCAALAIRWPRSYPVMLVVANTLYTIPSLVLIVVMPVVLGTQILDATNVVAALTIYSLALLVRALVDGIRSVPEEVKLAASAVGYGRLRQLVGIELPLAVPVIVAGLRVVTVSNISMVSVGSIVGLGGLGQLLTEGFQVDSWSRITGGIVGSVLLAVTADVVLVLSQRRLTPWQWAVGGAR
jgi:osmoprotectant transport system permease protein